MARVTRGEAGRGVLLDLGKHNVIGVLENAIDYKCALARIQEAASAHRPLAVSAFAVHGVMTGYTDEEHRARLNSFDLVVPDGQPVRWALNLLHSAGLRDQVYGPNLTLETCALCTARRPRPSITYRASCANASRDSRYAARSRRSSVNFRRRRKPGWWSASGPPARPLSSSDWLARGRQYARTSIARSPACTSLPSALRLTFTQAGWCKPRGGCRTTASSGSSGSRRNLVGSGDDTC